MCAEASRHGSFTPRMRHNSAHYPGFTSKTEFISNPDPNHHHPLLHIFPSVAIRPLLHDLNLSGLLIGPLVGITSPKMVVPYLTMS
jgi:hypothetical protein